MIVVHLASIVEGHGEVAAVPVLIRRVAALYAPDLYVVVRPPVRKAPSRLVLPGQLEREVEALARPLPPASAILVLLDCDDAASCRHGPQLLARARSSGRTAHPSRRSRR